MKTIVTAFLLVVAFGLTSLNASTPTQSTPPRWELLGLRKVNYGLDHDEILVTAREGKFTAVKLIVRKGGINMHRMVIHYGNGNRQDVDLRQNIPANGETRVIDLEGQGRIINRVEFWYDTKNFARGRATLQLWGRH